MYIPNSKKVYCGKFNPKLDAKTNQVCIVYFRHLANTDRRSVWRLRTLLTRSSYCLCQLEQSLNIWPSLKTITLSCSLHFRYLHMINLANDLVDEICALHGENMFISCIILSSAKCLGPLPQAGLIEEELRWFQSYALTPTVIKEGN